MHKLGVFVHNNALFSPKYLFISKKVFLCTQIFN